MIQAIVATPVKDSLETTRRTLEAISSTKGDFLRVVFNDFSQPETRSFLETQKDILNYRLVHLEEHTSNPSPNYRLALRMAQQMALDAGTPLIIIESDVIIKEDTLEQLLSISRQLTRPGLAGVITTDAGGQVNFPYAHAKPDPRPWHETTRSLSFCCTLLSYAFLQGFDFGNLPPGKDWYDIHISRLARKKGFRNYLIREISVVHLPHSSRPWKQLKYTHPFRYYLYKLLRHRDRI